MYLEIDEGFTTHRKTLRFCGLMQDHNAFAYLLRLWSWANRSAPDGELSGLESVDIEIAVQYRQADGKCYAAMVKAGFIDEDEAGRPGRIHNWMERQGAAILRMESAAKSSRERKERWKERQRNADGTAEERVPERSGNAVGTKTERAENAHRQDKASPGKSSLPDPDPPPSPELSDPDRAGALSSAPPFRPARRLTPVALVTIPFKEVYDRYPNKDGRLKAAEVWHEIAETYPGGEAALRTAILGWFVGGSLKRHPYAGEGRFRPLLETVLAERRWEDDQSAPDDVNHGQSASSRKPRELPFA